MKIAKTWEEHESNCRKQQAKDGLIAGKEGWEFWQDLGEIHHIYAFRFRSGLCVRCVSPAHNNPGLFNPKPQGLIKA